MIRSVKQKALCSHLDQLFGNGHSNLDCVRADVLKHRVNLPSQKVSVHCQDTRYPYRVLSCQGRDGAHSEYAVHNHGF